MVTIGRYRVSGKTNCNPSRTTVDINGNCYVGTREAGTVVKVGLLEAGQYVDRNHNGQCDTCHDSNNDGKITGSEILPWGQDECVMYEVVLIPGHIGVYAPGDYSAYDGDYWGTSPRGLAIDSKNNLWASAYSPMKFYYINGETGQIEKTIDTAPYGHSSYGAVIDKNGVLWSAALSSHVLRINTADSTDIIKIPLSHTYGLGLDYADHLFVGGSGALTKIDINDKVNPIKWTKSAIAERGVTCTADNNVWVAHSGYGRVSRYDNEGNLLATITGFNQPSGVGVDAVGKVWATNIGDDNIFRIDPATNTIDLTVPVSGSGGHYTYSDMTGNIARTITTKTGAWTVKFDSQQSDMPWGKVSWTADTPVETSIVVKVRSSNDESTWSGWETVANGDSISTTPPGRYLEIETTMQITKGEVSPILYDLTVKVGNQPPVANAGADQTVEQANLAGTNVTLDGSGSSDDGLISPLTYTWTWNGQSITGDKPIISLPLGSTTVTLNVSDGQFSSTDAVNVTVQDTTPPMITASDKSKILWPANHKYQTVSISDLVSSVTDICDANVGINNLEITSVSSDEPEDANGNGDGNTLTDIVIKDSKTVDLRAEREGTGNGRVYTISYKVMDASGNKAAGSSQVWVPHDMNNTAAVDNGAVAGYTLNYP